MSLPSPQTFSHFRCLNPPPPLWDSTVWPQPTQVWQRTPPGQTVRNLWGVIQGAPWVKQKKAVPLRISQEVIVLSSKLSSQWKSTFWDRKYIFKWWIFHCYVSAPKDLGPSHGKGEWTCMTQGCLGLQNPQAFEGSMILRGLDIAGSYSTLLKTNSSHLKMVVSNRNLLFQGSIFRCYVSFREGSKSLGFQPPFKQLRVFSLNHHCWTLVKGF